MIAAATLSLIVAALGFIAAAVYTYLTWGLLGETRRMRQAQTEPELLVYLEQSERAFNHLNLVVRNIGAGTAFDVRLEVLDDWEITHGRMISGLGLVRQGLALLPAKDAIRSYAVDAEKAIGRERTWFRLAVTYRSTPTAAPVRREFTLDVKSFEGIIALGEAPSIATAKALKSIAERLNRIGSAHSRLQVDTYSANDRVREEQALQESIDAARAEIEANYAQQPQSPGGSSSAHLPALLPPAPLPAHIPSQAPHTEPATAPGDMSTPDE